MGDCGGIATVTFTEFDGRLSPEALVATTAYQYVPFAVKTSDDQFVKRVAMGVRSNTDVIVAFAR
jgi:hypothetical protein